MIDKIISLLKKIDNLTIKKKTNDNTNIVLEKKSNIQKTKKLLIFNIKSIDYNDKISVLEKIINDAFKNDIIERFDGYTNKDIRELNTNVWEVNNVYLNIDFKENNKKLEVYCNDLTDNNKVILIGYVPQNKKTSVLEVLDYAKCHPEYEFSKIAYIMGGHGKGVDYDNTISDFYYSYKLEIHLEVKEK